MKQRSSEQAELLKLWTKVVIRVLLVIGLVIVVFWALYALRTVLLLLVLSIFFCYMIAPLVRVFEQPVYVSNREIRLPRGAAIIVVYVLMGTVFYVGLQLFLPILWQQVTDLGNNLPNYVQGVTTSVNKAFNDANGWVGHLKLPQKWRDYLISQASHLAESLLLFVGVLLPGVWSFLLRLPWLILIPVLSFFLLKDAPYFERAAVELVPERLQKRFHYLLLDVSKTIAAYIRAQITACIAVGAITTVGFGLIGVPYAVVLGAVCAVLEFLPMVGPLLSAVIVFSISLTISVKMAFVVALFLIILRIVQDYIIYPRIVGQGIKMHPLVVVLAIFGGAEVGGLAGVFLAIPFVALLIVGYNHFLAYKGLRELKPTATGNLTVIAVDEAPDRVPPEPEVSASGSLRD